MDANEMLVCWSISNLFLIESNCVHSSRIGDVEDFPDMRVDAASPGPRVTFNIQDTVK